MIKSSSGCLRSVIDHRPNYTAKSNQIFFFSANLLKLCRVDRVRLARCRARIPRDRPLISVLSRRSLVADFVYTSAILIDDTVCTWTQVQPTFLLTAYKLRGVNYCEYLPDNPNEKIQFLWNITLC